jgi:hypothetical protein
MIKSALTLLAVAGSGLFAQGGEPSTPLATVEGQPPIEQQHFDHWLEVAARSSSSTHVVPDPPTGRPAIAAASRRNASR